MLRDINEELLDQYEETHNQSLRGIQKSSTMAIAERRVLVTQALGYAGTQFCLKHQELIAETFRKLGLTLPIDGSSDEELSVKGIDSSLLRIGDWRYHEPAMASQETGPLVEEEVEDIGIEFVDRE
ncbi:hypothetical protein HOY82DRAFT_614237 [Tuber indicum]|nr:hypothetical protein HOY82DRAFT_614237 [Tuber indicum]